MTRKGRTRTSDEKQKMDFISPYGRTSLWKLSITGGAEETMRDHLLRHLGGLRLVDLKGLFKL